MVDLDKSVKSYFNQGKYIFLYNVFERLTFFAFYISIARYVDKETYGLVVSVSAFTNILASIFDLGLPFYIQRESAIGRFGEKILSKLIVLKLILIITLLPLPILYFLNEQNLIIVLLISLINFYHPVNQILVFYLNGKGKFKENFYSILLTRLMLFILLICFTIYKINIVFSLFSILIILVSQTFYLIKHLKEFSLIKGINNFRLSEIFDVLKFSLPFGLGVIFTMTYDRVDVLILKHFAGNVDVAIYSIAYSLYRHTSVFSTAILLPNYNTYSKLFASGNKLKLDVVWTDLKFLLGVSICLIILFQFLGDVIIKILYTNKFLEANVYLKLISFAIPFIFLNNFTGILLNSKRLEIITMITTFLGLIINVISNFILIPNLRVYGAVYSTILTEALILITQAMALKKFN